MLNPDTPTLDQSVILQLASKPVQLHPDCTFHLHNKSQADTKDNKEKQEKSKTNGAKQSNTKRSSSNTINLYVTKPGIQTTSLITQNVETVVMIAANGNQPGGAPESSQAQEESICQSSNALWFVPGKPNYAPIGTSKYEQPCYGNMPQNSQGYGDKYYADILNDPPYNFPPYLTTNVCLNGWSYRIASTSDVHTICAMDESTYKLDPNRAFTPVFVTAPDLNYAKNIDNISNDPNERACYVQFIALQLRMTIEHALLTFKDSKISQKRLLLTVIGGGVFNNNVKLLAAIYKSVLSEYSKNLQGVECFLVWPPKEFITYFLQDNKRIQSDLKKEPVIPGYNAPITPKSETHINLNILHELHERIESIPPRSLQPSHPYERLQYYEDMPHDTKMTDACEAFREYLYQHLPTDNKQRHFRKQLALAVTVSVIASLCIFGAMQGALMFMFISPVLALLPHFSLELSHWITSTTIADAFGKIKQPSPIADVCNAVKEYLRQYLPIFNKKEAPSAEKKPPLLKGISKPEISKTLQPLTPNTSTQQAIHDSINQSKNTRNSL